MEEEKGDGVILLFSVNFNGLGPCVVGKIDQILDSGMRKKIYGLMISSSDVRRTKHNKNKMIGDLKKTKYKCYVKHI